MHPQSEETTWKQHFPTYRFSERDIALEEYGFATKALESEERVFINAANLALIVGAALGSLALGSLDKLISSFSPVVPRWLVVVLVILTAAGFGTVSLRYFADRQKAVVFSTRKVIVLRRMLGMSYGSLQLVLPNWRVEGADEPFSVRIFPGWRTYVAYPFYVISTISTAVVFFGLSALMRQGFIYGGTTPSAELYFSIGITAAWFVALSWIYRTALLDTHERPSLVAYQWLSNRIRLSLVNNVEYVIYRATLATYELRRLGVDLAVAKRILVHVEDKEFFSHSGVSFRGLARLLLHFFGRRRRSGGSTITQQLARTLFIRDQTKLIRRKIVEIGLALWLDKVFSKQEQAEMYLASVRFETGVFGIVAAMHYFFGDIRRTASAGELFFLIERVSNIRSRLLVEKIDQTLRSLISAKVLTEEDAKQAILIYSDAVKSGKLIDPEGVAIKRLRMAWLD